MPAFLALPIGLAFPTLIGWLLLRIAEGSKPVLFTFERWIAGFVLGCIAAMYAIFLTEISGIGSFSVWSMLLTQSILIAGLGFWYYTKRSTYGVSPALNLHIATLPLWQKIVFGLAGVWVLAKLAAGCVVLAGPAYFDDVVSNWNMRGKAFYVDQQLVLDIDRNIAAYPQSVPLVKTWLANLHGSWSEALVNMPHILWYISLLALVFFALRRRLSTAWALLGTYILASIPFVVMHGAVAYADLFLSSVIFLAVSWLYFAARSNEPARSTFLRIGAIATALLIFTKNEALLLHLPPILLLFTGVLLVSKEQKNKLLWYGIAVAAVLLPWVLFKWTNNLNFGNAKEVSGMVLEWHAGVLQAIFSNTFLEGNWSLLPGVFFGLLLLHRVAIVRTALCIPVFFVLIVIAGQLPIYLLTNLYVEAINQTGYARGILHLVPLIVFCSTILLRSSVENEQ